MLRAGHDCIDVSVDVVCQRVATRAARCDRDSCRNPLYCGEVGRKKAIRDKCRGERREDEKIPDLRFGEFVIRQ